MARLDASRLGDGGGTTTVKTAAEKAAIKTQADSVVSKIKLNEAVRNNPLTKVTPAPAAEQVGPLLGANAPKFTPVGKVVTQSGEEIEVDASGKSATGGVPVGSTKAEVKELKGDREKLARFAMGVTSILEDVTEILDCQDNGDLAEVYMDFHCSIPDNEDEDEDEE
jgi:hypothetical protein